MNSYICYIYMLTRLAEIYAANKAEGKNLQVFELLYYFNAQNDFTKDKCGLFPFILTIADADRGLYFNNVCKTFKPLEEGFICNEFQTFIRDENNYNIWFNFRKNFTLQFEEEYIRNLYKAPSTYEYYKKLYPECIKQFDSVELSIKYLLDVRRFPIANLDYDRLLHWNKNNDVFQDYKKYYDKNGLLIENEFGITQEQIQYVIEFDMIMHQFELEYSTTKKSYDDRLEMAKKIR